MNFSARQIRIALALLGLALSQPGCAGARQNPAGQEGTPSGQTFQIAGTVVSATTGAALSQARIFLSEVTDRGKTVSMITSEDGHFEFKQLRAGKYSLEGAKRGFIASAYNQHEQYSSAIVTGPGYSTEHLVLRLTPMALIAGHVIDEYGDPVRDAQVALYFESHSAGMSRIIRIRGANSDDLGFYDFSLLRPGKYYISVTAKPWYAIHPVTASGPGNSPAGPISPALDVTYPTTYYDGATEADSAASIEVKGGERQQIDLHLNPVPALHLIFRMPENRPGQPNNFSMPELQKQVFDSLDFVQSDGMRPVAPGVFEITGIAPGRYTVRLKNSDSGQLEQSAGVDLTRDGQNLNDTGGEPLGRFKLLLKVAGPEPLPKEYGVALQNSRRRIVAYKRGDASGQLLFEDLAPGRYAILIGAQARPYSVMKTSSEEGDSAGHEVNIIAGATVELTATIAAGMVNIEGVVHKKDKPAAGVMVALVPKDPVTHVEMFRRDQSDSDGTFALNGVIPGSYTIVAVEDAWGLEWLQPSVLERYVQHGKNVTVDEMMHGSFHLPDPVEVQPH